jgi:hypothetical protein
VLLHSFVLFSFLQLSSLSDLPQSLSFIYDELSPWLVARANQKKNRHTQFPAETSSHSHLWAFA